MSAPELLVSLLVWIVLIFVTLFWVNEISFVLISNTDVSSHSAMRGSDCWGSMKATWCWETRDGCLVCNNQWKQWQQTKKWAFWPTRKPNYPQVRPKRRFKRWLFKSLTDQKTRIMNSHVRDGSLHIPEHIQKTSTKPQLLFLYSTFTKWPPPRRSDALCAAQHKPKFLPNIYSMYHTACERVTAGTQTVHESLWTRSPSERFPFSFCHPSSFSCLPWTTVPVQRLFSSRKKKGRQELWSCTQV